MSPSCPVSCIILSAGDSGRMGTHKALLPFGRQKVSFLEQILQVYSQAGMDEMVVVVNSDLLRILNELKPELPEQVRITENPHPEKGRFYSLQTGLKHVTADACVFIQNIDNPFIDRETLHNMLKNLHRAQVILPAFTGKTGHPVLVHPEVCRSILSSPNPDARLDSFLKDFSSVAIEVENPRILANVNTPEDYEDWFDLTI